MAYRDRKRARACIDRLLAWPFERVVLAHGAKHDSTNFRIMSLR
jgi:hypothetical protein